MLFRYIGTTNYWHDPDGVSVADYQPNKIYKFTWTPEGPFEEVDGPPDCLFVSWKDFVETCDALINWMEGPIAQGLE